MNRFWLLLLIPIAAAGVWFFAKKNDAPAVPVAQATRMNISNTLSTNGKVEPEEYAEARAEVSGLVKRVFVQQGDAVKAGQALAELSQPGLEEELHSAEARVAQVTAELSTLRAGGRGADLAEIDGNLNRIRTQLDFAKKNLEATKRLIGQHAATPYEADQLQHTIDDLDAQRKTLEQRRGAMVGKGEIDAAEARLKDAQVAIDLAHRKMALSRIAAPLAGVLYSLPAKAGVYLNAGDAVGSIGKLNPVKVRVYVDEPELGRVSAGQPVRITWDAQPAKEWKGTVGKLPTEIIALGTRQVGEVLCTIENPGNELVPGTNINAFILTQVVNSALTVPKTALRHDSGTGVFVLQKDDSLHWLPVKTGASDALRVEITDGLKEGDSVALTSDQTLREGMKISPTRQ